ncbi:MAG TPA: low temperature requirement protein A [Ilumatobacteraceae bacterium]|nr:low temperature requirement protein A [Ilumatobacteraceae bacterium]
MVASRSHRLIPMSGRDPNERHRASTPLELLFDLTFVVAISVTANQAAQLLAAGQTRAALVGFGFGMFACIWPWINFSWFASAYDTDDSFMRLATMVQMAGVLIMALGLPEMFNGLVHQTFSNRVMVAGYVVMRIGMIALWIRAGLHDPRRRRTCFAYAKMLAVAQIGWTMLAVLQPTGFGRWLMLIVLYVIEVGGVYAVESRYESTAWHAEHIAERYSLLTIITLGEVVLGTTTAIRALVDTTGWSVDAVLVAGAGVSLTFGMWWVYFITPYGEILSRRRRAFGWGYGHLAVFVAIAAVGAGLQVAAHYASRQSALGPVATILCLVVPVGVFVITDFALFHHLLPGRDRFHLVLLLLTIGVAVASLAAAATGVGLAWCLAIVMITPWITVVGYEWRGHARVARLLAQLESD